MDIDSHGTRSSNVAMEDAPDPDEDDLDDLDEMLDEFSATKLENLPSTHQPLETSSDDKAKDAGVLDADGDEFNRQLQNQMAALMGNLDESPQMKREIGAMVEELGATADSEASKETDSRVKNLPADSGISAKAEEPFQETIRKTMERMQASGERATAAADSEAPDDILAQLLNEMQGEGLEKVEGEEGFNKMLMGMMEQLTNKEILYDPMKELRDKFPAWMAEHQASTMNDDLQRYQKQQNIVEEIVERFEKSDYSDSNVADREFIVERMQQMQAAGSPPADLVGDMNAMQEPLGDLESGCPQQ